MAQIRPLRINRNRAMVRAMDYGAPPSLAMQAKRTIEQDALLTHVRQLQIEAQRMIRLLKAHPGLDRTSLQGGEVLVTAGMLLLESAITREGV